MAPTNSWKLEDCSSFATLEPTQLGILLLSLALLSAARLWANWRGVCTSRPFWANCWPACSWGPPCSAHGHPRGRRCCFHGKDHGDRAGQHQLVGDRPVPVGGGHGSGLVAGVETGAGAESGRARDIGTVRPGPGGTLVVPQSLGRQAGADPVVFALFLGTAMAISALPVIIKTLMDLDLYRTDLGMVVVSAAVFNDLIGWTVFASIWDSWGRTAAGMGHWIHAGAHATLRGAHAHGRSLACASRLAVPAGVHALSGRRPRLCRHAGSAGRR